MCVCAFNRCLLEAIQNTPCCNTRSTHTNIHTRARTHRPAGSSASDFLYDDAAAAEGQGLGSRSQPSKSPLVGWEADAEAQAQSLNGNGYDNSGYGSSANGVKSASYASWSQHDQDDAEASKPSRPPVVW